MDKGLTGTNRARPGLDQAMAAVRKGDTLVAPGSSGTLNAALGESGGGATRQRHWLPVSPGRR